MAGSYPIADEDDDLLFEPGDLENMQDPRMIEHARTTGAGMNSTTARVKSKDTREINNEDDVMVVRSMVKRISALLGFSLVNQTKIVTAASEIARNTLEHGKGGKVTLELLETDASRGIRMIFEDNGPGIPDVEAAMQDGFTSGGGMGLGLGGSKRLTDEFEIQSKAGEGTRVTMTKWSA